MGTLTSRQLQGSGSLYNTEITTATTINLSTGDSSQAKICKYITFDVEGVNLSNVNFTQVSPTGVKLNVAYSKTNFAYCLPPGVVNTWDISIASNLPTIPAGKLRIRSLGLIPTDTAIVTIEDPSSSTGEIGVFVIGTTFEVGAS